MTIRLPSFSKVRWVLSGVVLALVLTLKPWAPAEFGVANADRPQWTLDPEMPGDVFTFVRIEYRSSQDWRGYDRWQIDFPDGEINFSWRLQQLTSLRSNPNPITRKLTDKDLTEYPFIYIVEPGFIDLSEAEEKALRNYLLNGGFLMVDDFWGENEWENFAQEFKNVFPDRPLVDIPPDHPIFNIVFRLKKDELQIPNYGVGTDHEFTQRTWERPDAKEVHFRGVFDDKGRLMCVVCHNTDLGDGWEREGENPYYFKHFSEPKAYPLGINIVVYAMTH